MCPSTVSCPTTRSPKRWYKSDIPSFIGHSYCCASPTHITSGLRNPLILFMMLMGPLMRSWGKKKNFTEHLITGQWLFKTSHRTLLLHFCYSEEASALRWSTSTIPPACWTPQYHHPFNLIPKCWRVKKECLIYQ